MVSMTWYRSRTSFLGAVKGRTLGIVKRMQNRFNMKLKPNHNSLETLAQRDNRLLDDIGVTRADLEALIRTRALAGSRLPIRAHLDEPRSVLSTLAGWSTINKGDSSGLAPPKGATE